MGAVIRMSPRAPAKTGNGQSSPRLVRETLSRKLCALITNGTYKPGDRITEREISERLKASRPSIRETFRQLEAEGLLDIHPNRGAVVRTLDLSVFLELWEVRLALETLIAERFARHGTTVQIERFERAIESMDAALRSKDRTQIRTAKSSMFEAFGSGASNTMLVAYFQQLNVRLSFLWSSSLSIPGRPAESIGELRALAAAIRNRNPEAARAAVILYNEHSKASAMYALRSFIDSQEKADGGRSRR